MMEISRISTHMTQVSIKLSQKLDKLDLINNLNSIKMLAVSDAFETYPEQRVDVDQFVKIMKEVLDDTSLVKR